MRIKLLTATLLFRAAFAYGDINVTEGSGKVVPTDTVSGKEYQKIKIVDGTAGGISPAPVDPVGGLSVRLTTSTAIAGSVLIAQPSVLGATVTFNGAQPVTILQPNVIGATVTFNGTQNVQVLTSTLQVQQSGPFTVQPGNTPNTQDWKVTMSTNAAQVILSTIQVQGAVQVVISTIQIQGSAQVVTSTLQVQGSMQVVTSTLQVQVLNPLTANTVNITTAIWNAAIPANGSIIGGIGPTGAFQTFAVDASSQVKITGSLSSTMLTTATFNQAYPNVGSAEGFSGPTGLIQTGRVDISSNQYVRIDVSTIQVQGAVQVITSTLQIQGSAQVITSTLQVQGTVSANAGTGNFNTIGPLQLLTVTGSTATVGYQGVISSIPVAIQGTASVQILTSTLQVQMNGTSNVQVITSTNQVQGSVMVVTSTLQVQGIEQGFAASGAAASGNPLQIGVRVTSTTVPTAASDGQVIYQASDNMGRQLVTGMPWGVILSTYATVMSSNGVLSNTIGGSVLVSSAGADKRTYLCSIAFSNTSATANEAVIMSPPGTLATVVKTKFIGIPASFVPSGVRHDCSNPFFASAINSNIGIYQSQSAGATAAIHYDATYFQGP